MVTMYSDDIQDEGLRMACCQSTARRWAQLAGMLCLISPRGRIAVGIGMDIEVACACLHAVGRQLHVQMPRRVGGAHVVENDERRLGEMVADM
jgi:hypothetical protein